MREEDQGKCRDLSKLFDVSLKKIDALPCLLASAGCFTHFSSSSSLDTSKDSSQPTSISTLTPPSSSSSDCDAVESDRAPCSGQNVNMIPWARELFWRAASTVSMKNKRSARFSTSPRPCTGVSRWIDRCCAAAVEACRGCLLRLQLLAMSSAVVWPGWAMSCGSCARHRHHQPGLDPCVTSGP